MSPVATSSRRLIRRPRLSQRFVEGRISGVGGRVRPGHDTLWSIGLLRGGHWGGGLALGLQFEEGAAVILGGHLDKGGERLFPVFEEEAGPRAAGEEVVALDEDAQPLGVKAQRITHA